jgi:hypothetical protein
MLQVAVAVLMAVVVLMVVFTAALAVFAVAPVPFVAESMADLDPGFIPAARI